jgi:hypothetical protein
MDRSTLGELASELQDMIWDFSVHLTDAIWIVEKPDQVRMMSVRFGCEKPSYTTFHQPLLRTCKYIRSQAYKRVFAVNTFTVFDESVGKVDRLLNLFFDDIGDNVTALGKLRINIPLNENPKDVCYLEKVFIPTMKLIHDTCSRAPSCNIQCTVKFRSKEGWPPDDHINMPGKLFYLDIDVRTFEEQWKDIETLIQGVSDLKSDRAMKVAKECWTRLFDRRMQEYPKYREWMPQPPDCPLFVVAAEKAAQSG